MGAALPIPIFLRPRVLGIMLTILSSGACQAAGQIPYGTREGMAVTIRNMDGINGDRAVIKVEHTRENAREYCTGYLSDQSEACVDKALKEVRIADTQKGNCHTGKFVNLRGENIAFAGANLDHKANPASPQYKLFKQGNQSPLSETTASGYFPNLEQFKTLCPTKYGDAMLAYENRPKYIGRWYADGNKLVCRADEGETEGLLTYKSREFVGIETRCKFTAIRPIGERYTIMMTCAGEGRDWNDREVLEVRNGKLERTVMVERKPVTFTYDRCP